jgi:ribonuclease T1
MLGLLAVSHGVYAKETVIASNLDIVSLAELPRQGAETYRLIHQGGPFPYEKDGVVFGNRERKLAPQKRGYYHEYTVATPGERHRGTRRIVCGGAPKAPDACFYTADHYASFRKIAP